MTTKQRNQIPFKLIKTFVHKIVIELNINSMLIFIT